MDRRTILGVLIAIALIVVVAGAGVSVYDAGVAHGVAQGAQVAGSGGALHPRAFYGYGGYGLGFRPFGFGFGIFFPILILFLFFGLIRALIWRPFGRGWGYRRRDFEDWHRRQHESPGTGDPGRQEQS